MQHANNRPDTGADQKTHLQANNVDQPAADRLKYRIGQLERRHHPGVLLGSHVEAGFQFRCQNAQRITGDVVDRYAQ
ncbi:hypothetical protein D3C72_1752860 [compost metagenome]